MIIRKVNDYIYEVAKTGPMNVPLKIYASEKLMEKLRGDKSIEQGMNVAALPGIIKESIMLPDAHQGYGFSIGGVAAFPVKNGIITPGGIGFDINCGVRLMSTDLDKGQVEERIKQIVNDLYKNVPSGVGSESKIKLSVEELDEVLVKGAKWAVENGYGKQSDIEHTESEGLLATADPAKVSKKAKKRGKFQVGTLGAGNHFLEVQFIDEIYNPEVANTFGIISKGQIMVMIHCGSRGLGHQVCSDYLRKMEDAYPEVIKRLPEKDLIYAPFNSQLGQDYFKAMSCAANYAWANRQVIAHLVRNTFSSLFTDPGVRQVYDVAHNIAKIEEHEVDGRKMALIVHRKGATRAFPSGHEEVPEAYREVGQPVLIPGSMGTASYVLVGSPTSMTETFGSTAHGAGRVMSRHGAKRMFRGEQIKQDLEKKNIYVKAGSWKGIAEEAPGVYKDIDEVIKVSNKAGIGKVVARLRPLGVVKG